MKKVVGILCCMAVLLTATAQDMATCPDSIFRLSMRNIVSKGNHYYDVSNIDGLRQMIDSINSSICIRSNKGRLNIDDSLEFTADMYKLDGSYHYERSFYDSLSLPKAHESYRKALEIYRRHTNFDNLQCEPMIHRELAILYYKERNYLEAYQQMKQAYNAFESAAGLGLVCENDSDYLDIQTQMALCQARMGKYKEAIAMMDKLIDGYKETDIHYGEALRKKAKILMLQEENEGKTCRSEALACYKKYFALKEKDALEHFLGMSSREREMYWMRIRPFVTDCYRLEDADAGFLYDVTLFAKGLLLQLDSVGGGRQNINATWQMVQERLKPDACAIEFVQYEKYGRQQMGALVLKNTGAPVFVSMPKPDDVMGYEIGPWTVGQRIYNTDPKRKNPLYKDTTGIFKIIWHEQLLSTIGNAKKVYFAPDGYIHQVAIEFMLPSEGSNLQTHRVSSTRVLMEESPTVVNKHALVIGGIDYLHSDERTEYGNDVAAYNHFQWNNGFRPLEKSLAEAEEIIKIRNNPEDTLIVGSHATEPVFRENCRYYPIIHLSTHGKFAAASVPQGTDLKPCLADESLSQSIIALSGLEASLNDSHFDAESQDGVLSAKELSSQNLKKTELVVLSCCETGLGYVTADGLYGIQRGLKNAGAKAIICTLWEVWDVAAAFFISNFYRYLSEGQSIYDSFCKARENMIDYRGASEDFNLSKEAITKEVQLAGGNDFSEPENKNVFILIDAIE